MYIIARAWVSFVVLTVNFIPDADSTPYENYSDLHTLLFKDYNVNLRPVRNGSLPLNVSVDFVLLSLDGLSEQEQALTTNGWLLLEWVDEILTWDERETGVPSFTVQQKTIWRPDVTIKNTVKQRSKIGFDEQPVSLKASGHVTWAPGDIFVTSCDLAVTYYPFDVQTCNIVVYLWISPDTEVKLFPGEKKVSLDTFSQNGLWEIQSTSTSTETNQGFTEVIFTLNLKRRRLFYIVNIVIPVVFLSCLAPLVFALPAESGEKMGFCITVLLAYTVFLTILSDNMPKTSIETAILSFYLTVMVIISATSVLLSTLVLRLHHKSEDSSPSRRLQNVIRFLRRILCLRAARSSSTVTPTVKDKNTTNKMSEKSEDRLQNAYAVAGVNAEMSWKIVAETLDVVFFIVFAILTIVITLPSLAIMAAQKIT